MLERRQSPPLGTKAAQRTWGPSQPNPHCRVVVEGEIGGESRLRSHVWSCTKQRQVINQLNKQAPNVCPSASKKTIVQFSSCFFFLPEWPALARCQVQERFKHWRNFKAIYSPFPNLPHPIRSYCIYCSSISWNFQIRWGRRTTVRNNGRKLIFEGSWRQTRYFPMLKNCLAPADLPAASNTPRADPESVC